MAKPLQRGWPEAAAARCSLAPSRLQMRQMLPSQRIACLSIRRLWVLGMAGGSVRLAVASASLCGGASQDGRTSGSHIAAVALMDSGDVFSSQARGCRILSVLYSCGCDCCTALSQSGMIQSTQADQFKRRGTPTAATDQRAAVHSHAQTGGGGLQMKFATLAACRAVRACSKSDSDFTERRNDQLHRFLAARPSLHATLVQCLGKAWLAHHT